MQKVISRYTANTQFFLPRHIGLPVFLLCFSVLALLPCPGAAISVFKDDWSSLDFHGYLRTGAGNSRGGTQQAQFQLPGARAKYRLGNEANTNYELALDYRVLAPNVRKDAYLQAYVMADDYKTYAEYSKLGIRGYPQYFLNLAGFIKPGVNLWLGRRYYDRKDIHMIDHFWLNAGQGAEYGGGIEGIPIFSGKLKIAAFALKDEEVKAVYPGSAYLSPSSETLRSTNIDLRLAQLISNPGGEITLWATFTQRKSNDTLGYARKNGYGLGFWHDQKFSNGWRNTLSLLYRKGSALNQGDFNPNPVREDQGFDLDHASAIELNNNLLIESADLPFSMQWVAVLRKQYYGKSGARGETLEWYSTGIRPIWYFSQHINLALELGVDYVNDAVHDRKGSLRKATLALQFSKSRGYYSRPVARLFVTQAAWGDEFKGLVGTAPGDAPYANDTNGWTVGFQVESWW